MKKLLVGLLAALLMTSGLVAFSGSSASARPADCPYPGCIDTVTNGTVKNVKRNSAKIKVKVRAVGSNATPKKFITLTVVKVKKNGNLKEQGTFFGKLNKKGKVVFKVGALRAGKTYAFASEFENNEKFGFNYSTDNGTFKTKKKRR